MKSPYFLAIKVTQYLQMQLPLIFMTSRYLISFLSIFPDLTRDVGKLRSTESLAAEPGPLASDEVVRL